MQQPARAARRMQQAASACSRRPPRRTGASASSSRRATRSLAPSSALRSRPRSASSVRRTSLSVSVLRRGSGSSEQRCGALACDAAVVAAAAGRSARRRWPGAISVAPADNRVPLGPLASPASPAHSKLARKCSRLSSSAPLIAASLATMASRRQPQGCGAPLGFWWQPSDLGCRAAGRGSRQTRWLDGLNGRVRERGAGKGRRRAARQPARRLDCSARARRRPVRPARRDGAPLRRKVGALVTEHNPSHQTAGPGPWVGWTELRR